MNSAQVYPRASQAGQSVTHKARRMCSTTHGTGEFELSKLPGRSDSYASTRHVDSSSTNCQCIGCQHRSLSYNSRVHREITFDSRVPLNEIEVDEESTLSVESSLSPVEGVCHNCTLAKCTSTSALAAATATATNFSCSEIDEILDEMKFITDRMRREDEASDILTEYRVCALVIDRCCLFLFTAVTIISTLLCISKAPHLIV